MTTYSKTSAALDLLRSNGINNRYIGKNHYTTGSGTCCWGGENFYYTNGVVINTSLSYKPQNGKEWRIVAYHGTPWQNVNGILRDGLIPGNAKDCETFTGDKYGKGIYCSPYQSYAKTYDRGIPKKLGNYGKVRLVFGLRIKNSKSITKTTDAKIWLIKNASNVSVQDINLTFD